MPPRSSVAGLEEIKEPSACVLSTKDLPEEISKVAARLGINSGDATIQSREH